MIPAIYDRRSIRKFSSRPIDERDLLELMDSAARAPSSKNSQPWKYVIVTGNAKNEMLDAYRRSPGLPRRIPRAPAPQTFGGNPPLAALNFARTPPRPRPGPKPGRAGGRAAAASGPCPFAFSYGRAEKPRPGASAAIPGTPVDGAHHAAPSVRGPSLLIFREISAPLPGRGRDLSQNVTTRIQLSAIV